MDFTLSTYFNLIKTLQKQGFSFFTFEDSLISQQTKRFVSRHDVDDLPENSLEFAKIQAEIGIRGSYYFRIVPGSFNEKIIKEISSLGHEIGYHYEDFSLAASRHRASGIRRQKMTTGPQDRMTARLQDKGRNEEELAKIAIICFRENLEKLRSIAPVSTICMHGSPMSRWDSRLLWKYYDYHDFGIIGEPYFDINFNEVFYLTDTGRRWDGEAVSVRDKATEIGRKASGKDDRERGRVGERENLNPFINWKVKPFNFRSEVSEFNLPLSVSPSLPILPKFHSTFDIIKAAQEGRLPDKIMMTFHPQRWTDKPVPWVKELVWQNAKNVVKYFLVKLR